MKIVFTFICLLTTGIIPIFSQSILPLDDKGKVTFTEVVKIDSTFPSTLLFNNALRWTKLLRNEDKKPMTIKEDLPNGTVGGSHNFLVYQETFKVGVLRRVSGLITYDFKIETRQGRYKYTFTNFVFHYYDMARVNSYDYLTPKPNGRTKKLEDPKAPGWGDTWRAHKMDVLERMQSYGENLKKIMAEDPDKERFLMEKKTEEQKKLKTDW